MELLVKVKDSFLLPCKLKLLKQVFKTNFEEKKTLKTEFLKKF